MWNFSSVSKSEPVLKDFVLISEKTAKSNAYYISPVVKYNMQKRNNQQIMLVFCRFVFPAITLMPIAIPVITKNTTWLLLRNLLK